MSVWQFLLLVLFALSWCGPIAVLNEMRDVQNVPTAHMWLMGAFLIGSLLVSSLGIFADGVIEQNAWPLTLVYWAIVNLVGAVATGAFAFGVTVPARRASGWLR